MNQKQAIFKAISELNKVCAGKQFKIGDRQTIVLNPKEGANKLMFGKDEIENFEVYENVPLSITFELTEEPDEWRIVEPLAGLDIDALEKEFGDSEETRMRKFINDPFLKKIGEEMTRMQELLFGPEVVYDIELQEYKTISKPLIENANDIINKLQKQMNDYRNEHYPDLFPGK